MSITRAPYVSCDNCGEAGPVEAYEFTAKAARALARGEGFVRVNNLDLCPRCKPGPTARPVADAHLPDPGPPGAP
jgi:hypothetical protein